MRLATIRWRDSTSAAVVVGTGIAAVRDLPSRPAAYNVSALVDAPLTASEISELDTLVEARRDVTWLPPIPNPPKNVLCVGKNYLEHVKEGARAEGLSKAEVPTVPIWFSKPATALVGCGHDIEHDSAFTSALDYEGELAVVIGVECRRVPVDSALECVFGYTVINDVTARDVQQRHKQWFRGKSADTYAPCGPWIVTRDDIRDPQNLDIRTTVNGVVRQADNTRNMIFDIASLIADISAGMTLQPGDIIATGTPSGVAWGMDAPVYLRPGDEVQVEVQGIGRLFNRVVSADAVDYGG
jgi:2-keto-4-pentenoate hydratase/2-oxohepta-3-ene-1,7-dioic acid hydratase in catechol pathway